MSLERELDLHADEELLVQRMNLNMWSNHMRRIMEWKKTLMQSHPPKMVEGAPQKLID